MRHHWLRRRQEVIEQPWLEFVLGGLCDTYGVDQ
jgi:hypothetical protein